MSFRISTKRPIQRWFDAAFWRLFRSDLLKRETRTALASFPRSGNTWARVLIERATGLTSGTVYAREQVFKRCVTAGLRGVVVKTHELDGYRYNRAILLVRNPFDAFESLYCWRRDALRRVEVWERHVERCILRWRRHYQYWSSRPYDALIVRYEDLRATTEDELSRMLAYLELDATAACVQSAVQACQLGKLRNSPEASAFPAFFRRGEVGRGVGMFDSAQRALMTRELGPLLKRFGYAQLTERREHAAA